jgi:hypothetical protein
MLEGIIPAEILATNIPLTAQTFKGWIGEKTQDLQNAATPVQRLDKERSLDRLIHVFDLWKEKRLENTIREVEGLRLLIESNHFVQQSRQEGNLKTDSSFFSWVSRMFVAWIFAISVYNSMQIVTINEKIISFPSKLDLVKSDLSVTKDLNTELSALKSSSMKGATITEDDFQHFKNELKSNLLTIKDEQLMTLDNKFMPINQEINTIKNDDTMMNNQRILSTDTLNKQPNRYSVTLDYRLFNLGSFLKIGRTKDLYLLNSSYSILVWISIADFHPVNVIFGCITELRYRYQSFHFTIVHGKPYFGLLDLDNPLIKINKNFHNDFKLPSNSWVHLAVTYDKGTQRIFVNGILMQKTANIKPLEGDHIINLAQDIYQQGLDGR